jgi:integrase
MGVKVREKPPNSGIWWIFINRQGKRRAKKAGREKKLALAAAKKIEAKLALGDAGLPQEEQVVPKFGEYAQTWINVTVPATCKPSTLRDYQTILAKHFLLVFNKASVNQINRLMVKKFLMDKLNGGFAASTVTHMKNAIGGVLNLAVDDEVLAANPAHKLGRVIRHKGLRIDIDPLDHEELAHFLATFRSPFPRHYPLALTLARTGMRLGEALA